jgi:ABC-2 type transport system permease protein
MNVFWREIKAYRNSTLIWVIALSLLVVVFLTMYTAFTKDIETSRKILANLPPAIKKAFNFSSSNFFTIYGFFGYLFTFVGLAGTVQAMNYGVGILSKEDSGKTADFLLSKPISRTKVIISKLIAVLALVLFTNIIFSAVALTMAYIVSTDAFSSHTFLLISGILLLIQVFFVALGFLLSQIIPKIKSSITVALPAVFVFFFTGVIAAIIGDDKLYYLTPFKYYNTDYIIANSAYETKFLIIEAVFVVIALIVSYIMFINKDIKAPA